MPGPTIWYPGAGLRFSHFWGFSLDRVDGLWHGVGPEGETGKETTDGVAHPVLPSSRHMEKM